MQVPFFSLFFGSAPSTGSHPAIILREPGSRTVLLIPDQRNQDTFATVTPRPAPPVVHREIIENTRSWHSSSNATPVKGLPGDLQKALVAVVEEIRQHPAPTKDALFKKAREGATTEGLPWVAALDLTHNPGSYDPELAIRWALFIQCYPTAGKALHWRADGPVPRNEQLGFNAPLVADKEIRAKLEKELSHFGFLPEPLDDINLLTKLLYLPEAILSPPEHP